MLSAYAQKQGGSIINFFVVVIWGGKKSYNKLYSRPKYHIPSDHC